MKKSLIIVLALIIIAGGVIYFLTKSGPEAVVPNTNEVVDTSTTTLETVTSTTTEVKNDKETIIGKSINGENIIAYHFGSGEKELLLVGGIHGGYSWNTAALAYELTDYLGSNPEIIPEHVKVTIIPVLNPDGLKKVTGKAGRFEASDVNSSQAVQVSGRFNANTVDLNRNFDCDWQASGVWQSKKVSGGENAFSEPETAALKNYVDQNKPTAVIAWYSSAGGVYSSNCHNGVSVETSTLTKTFSKASGYPAHDSFNFYEITGDMVNWFAKNKIPAISVLLTNHTDTEFAKNKAGLEALLTFYK